MKQVLLAGGTKIANDIEVGIMIEIPSTAVQADQFVKEVDFFSGDTAHKQAKMCGEMVRNDLTIPLLLGSGLDEFSISATSILLAHTQIRQLNKSEIVELVTEALQMATAEEEV